MLTGHASAADETRLSSAARGPALLLCRGAPPARPPGTKVPGWVVLVGAACQQGSLDKNGKHQQPERQSDVW